MPRRNHKGRDRAKAHRRKQGLRARPPRMLELTDAQDRVQRLLEADPTGERQMVVPRVRGDCDE